VGGDWQPPYARAAVNHAAVLAIAATANAHNVPLLTHDAGDFRLIHDLITVHAP
jgi:predicted nucleic acid-binding protein